MKLILRIIINAVSIWITSLMMPGFTFAGTIPNLIAVGIVFGFVNSLIRPVVKLLSLPITILTLGLFTLVINTLMFMLTVSLDFLSLEGAIVQRFFIAFVAAIIISIVSTILSWFLTDDK